jgi:hypothetical protein
MPPALEATVRNCPEPLIAKTLYAVSFIEVFCTQVEPESVDTQISKQQAVAAKNWDDWLTAISRQA